MANNYDSNDMTGMFDTNDIESNKGISVVAYIPLLFLIPLLSAGNSGFAKFHANQGVILTVFSIACAVINALLGFVIGWIPVIGSFITLIVSIVLGLSVLALMIIGIINSAQGLAKKLPIIGDLLEVIK